MNKKILFVLGLLSFFAISYSREEDEQIFILGSEDDWSNAKEFATIIKDKLAAVSVGSFKDSVVINGKIEIFFRIDTIGKVDSCSIKKSFRPDIDTLFFNTLKELDFKKAAIYDNKGNPHPVNFTLPINLKSP